MADTQNKVLNTRIKLKYDSYANWQAATDVVLLKGEVAICEIPGSTTTVKDENGKDKVVTTAPTVLFKVGTYDGATDSTKKTFAELPWASAKAADVYDWAKLTWEEFCAEFDAHIVDYLNTEKWVDLTNSCLQVEGDENPTTLVSALERTATYAAADVLENAMLVSSSMDGKVAFAELDVEVRPGVHSFDSLVLAHKTSGVTADTYGGNGGSATTAGATVDIVVPQFEVNEYGHVTSADNKTYTVTLPTVDTGVMSVTEGTANGTIKVDDEDVKVHGLESAAYVTVESLNTTAEGYATGVKTGVENGTITAKNAETAAQVANNLTVGSKTFNGSTAVSLEAADLGLGNVNNTSDADKPVSTLQQQAIDAALEAAKKYADDNDTNTAHTHANGNGTVVTATGGIDGEVQVNLNVALELIDRNIVLYDKNDSTKAALATMSADEFIKDGMIKSVEIVDADDKGTSGKFLKITWNTPELDDADQVTYVDLTTLIDVYTAGTGLALEGREFRHADTSNVANVTKTARTYISGITFDDFGHVTAVETGVEVDQDLTHNHDTQYKAIQTAVEDVTANGTALEFISSVTQNAQGVITATKKTVDLTNYYNKGEIDGQFTTHTQAQAQIDAAQNEEINKKLDATTYNEYIATRGATDQALKDYADGAVNTLKTTEVAANTAAIGTINETLETYGDIVTHNVAEFATAAQGGKADTAIQSVTSVAGNGIVATTTGTSVSLDWDPNVVFVFDCGTSAE